MSLQKILLDRINETEDWISKGALGVVAESEGYLPESVGRHLRKMAEKGMINVSYYKSKRGRTLARYARLNTPKIEKPQINFEIRDGQLTAILT